MIKYQSTIVSTEFVRVESFSSKSKFHRYGKFKDTAYATLSCGHSRALGSIKVKDNGLCFCYECKLEDMKND